MHADVNPHSAHEPVRRNGSISFQSVQSVSRTMTTLSATDWRVRPRATLNWQGW